MTFKPRNVFHIYLAALSLAGMGVVWAATSRMGPGVSTDSAMILSTAENLLRGRGLVDYSGTELTQFPPLYSLILAGGSALFRQDVFVVGWILNVLVFGALIWFTGTYLRSAFGNEPILAYFGSFIIFSSTSLIEISANIASDPLFMLMVLFFCVLAAAYLRSGQGRYAAFAAVLTIVSCFQRYAGLALVITGSLVAAYAYRSELRRAFAAALVFGLITAAPIFAWGYLHNAPVNGTVFGARLPAVPFLNFTTGAEKVLYWFIPYRIISAAGAAYLLAAIVLVCVLALVATGIPHFLRAIAEPLVIPHVVFLLVYFSVLVLDISYYELKGINTDRVHIIALPSLLVLISVVGAQLLQAARSRVPGRVLYGIAIVLFVIWTSYPLSKSNEYVRASMARGDVSSYNSINKGDVQRSSMAEFLRGLNLQDETLYSNGGDTTWLMVRTLVEPVPILQSTARAAELAQRYAGWPKPGTGGYVVWLNAEAHKTNYATPEELSTIADLVALYTDQNGSVYSVRSR